MYRITTDKRVAVITALVEGCSVRSTVRMTGVSKGAILRLLEEVGTACAEYQDRVFRNLSCKRLQCDEIWSFIGAKEKNLTPSNVERGAIGDVWTWVAMDAQTKLVPSWLVADRGPGAAFEFMQDLAGRLTHRVQLTTDGHKVYLDAVDAHFGTGIDYAMLIKVYGKNEAHDTKYSPAECQGIKTEIISGDPDRKHISTSYIERQNLTMRMSMRRFTRLTNGFSKKLENHMHAVALFYMNYNFCRIHQTLRVTPAMEAGVSKHVWSIQEIIALTQQQEKIAA